MGRFFRGLNGSRFLKRGCPWIERHSLRKPALELRRGYQKYLCSTASIQKEHRSMKWCAVNVIPVLHFFLSFLFFCFFAESNILQLAALLSKPAIMVLRLVKIAGKPQHVGRCSMLCSLKFAKARECCGAAESRISIHMNSIPQRSWNTTLGCWAVGWAVADCDLRNRPFPLVTLNSSLNVPRFFVALRIFTQIHLPAPQGQCNRTKFQREWNSCRLKPKLVFGKGHSGDHSGWFYWNQVGKFLKYRKYW